MRVVVIVILIALVGGGLWLLTRPEDQPGPDETAGDQASSSRDVAVPDDGEADKDAEPVQSQTTDRTPPKPPEVQSPVHFTTMTDTGIGFVHRSGITEDRHYPCANGSGLAAIDIDADGNTDLYFATLNYFAEDESQPPQSNRCYRNLGDWKFADVTAVAGLTLADFSAGVAVGDFDGDGFRDLYVACVGENQLYRNQGDGTFERVTASGTNHAGFAASAVFFDQDNDGLQDLYVCTYGKWSIEDNKYCDDGQGKNLRVYCVPQDIEPAADVLYRNNGDGTFVDISDQLGVVRARGQGVVAADVNNDDFIDLYVGNDGNANTLITTDAGGGVTDATATAGVAYDRVGNSQAGMGVAASDVNRDGSVDLIVTNFENDHNTLYLGQDNRLFEDQSHPRGVVTGAMPWVGWGVSMDDFDLDTWPDLVVVNGHVEPRLFELGAGTEYEQPAAYWTNQRGAFRFVTQGAGDYFDSRHPARGLVVADLDNDGDHDLVAGHQDQAPAILRNDLPAETPRSIVLRCVGQRVNRDGIGCKVNVPGVSPVLSYQVVGGGSYLSTNDTRVIVATDQPTALEIVWPGGRRSSTQVLEPGGRYVVVEPLRGRTARVLSLP